MSSPEKKSGSLLPAIIAVLFLALIGVGVFFFLNQGVQKEGLYVYYPKDTVFFVELEPGKELADNALEFYKNQEAKAEAVLKKNDMAIPDKADALADTILAKEFNTIFEPHFSVGVWGPEDGNMEKGHVLAVAPLLNPEMTLEEFVPKLEKTMDDFEKTEYKEVVILSSKEKKELSLAIYDNKLMATSGEGVMNEALDHIMGKEEHIFNLPAHKTGLAKLPKKRIATIVVNYSEFPEQDDERLNDVQNMFPYLYAAGQLEQKKDMMLWDVYVPLFIEKAENEELKEAFRGFLAAGKNQFKAAGSLSEDTQFFLSLGRVDELLNIVIEQFGEKNAEFKKNLAGAQFMLGMMEIDLKKDIIGFFQEELVLAIRKDEGPIEDNENTAILLTADNTNKASTLKKLIKVASGGMIPVQHKNEQIGDVSVDTFVAPGQPQRISVAQLGSGMIAVTDPVEMDFLINVNKKKTLSLKDSSLFKEVTSSLPTTGITMFFMDMNDMDEQVEGLAGTFDSEGEKSFEAHVQVKMKPGILTPKK